MSEPMSGDRLVEIEVRARVGSQPHTNEHQRVLIATRVCRDDVPALLAEVRRLRDQPSMYSAGFRDGRASALPLDPQAPVIAGSS